MKDVIEKVYKMLDESEYLRLRATNSQVVQNFLGKYGIDSAAFETITRARRKYNEINNIKRNTKGAEQAYIQVFANQRNLFILFCALSNQNRATAVQLRNFSVGLFVIHVNRAHIDAGYKYRLTIIKGVTTCATFILWIILLLIMETKTIQVYECQDPKGRNYKLHKFVCEYPYKKVCRNCGYVAQVVQMIDLDALIANLEREIWEAENEVLTVRNDKKLHWLMGRVDTLKEVLASVRRC